MEEKPKEEWREVDGFDGYFISSRGRFKHGKRLLKQAKDKDGYMQCNIGHTKYRVHRLVAKAFIPNPDNLPVVDHIDGNKTNNNIDNLRWVTHQENTQSAYDMGLIRAAVRKDIIGVDPDGNAFIYESQVKAEEHTHIPRKTISKVVRGTLGSIHGYKFLSVNSITDLRHQPIPKTLS